MRIGERATPRRGPRGFTYVWLLFVIAATAAAAGMGVQSWQTQAAREREAEQIHRGRQIAAALASYRRASPGGKTWPRSLDELIDDRRSGSTRRHLRRLYIDPVTGLSDWELLTEPDGGIFALRSRSTLPAWRTGGMGEAPGAISQQRDRVYTAPS